ncbi:hypothetical protein RBU49_01750 [Clostridium sp. MB40-C1]|uniref:tail fiber protein n=1 Tax=Clostridium sp. MB40-C1 TaxID=3070996 RepID=UPI0027E1771C|nr:tail fiber protein [Clostridium sp. MB40-C1]WMJ81003.1 hypothetical protein RBU49_01750 [Clostridium sp. MB40-C1]
MEKLKGYIKKDNLDKQLISDTITKINTAQDRANSAYSLANSKQDKLSISSSTTSTSTTDVANSYAVKQAMDKANEAFQSASDGKNQIASAISSKGGSASSSDSFYTLASAIKNIKSGSEETSGKTERTGNAFIISNIGFRPSTIIFRFHSYPSNTNGVIVNGIYSSVISQLIISVSDKTDRVNLITSFFSLNKNYNGFTLKENGSPTYIGPTWSSALEWIAFE